MNVCKTPSTSILIAIGVDVNQAGYGGNMGKFTKNIIRDGGESEMYSLHRPRRRVPAHFHIET